MITTLLVVVFDTPVQPGDSIGDEITLPESCRL